MYNPADPLKVTRLNIFNFQISQTIRQSNESRKFAYTTLDPENIPNSIEI